MKSAVGFHTRINEVAFFLFWLLLESILRRNASFISYSCWKVENNGLSQILFASWLVEMGKVKLFVYFVNFMLSIAA